MEFAVNRPAKSVTNDSYSRNPRVGVFYLNTEEDDKSELDGTIILNIKIFTIEGRPQP
jgi:hypothetical protein